jgi:hypothetical protein
MALNPNYTFEELDGIKCSIVEKNVLPERVDFMKKILEYNKYTVVVAPSPPPKVVAKPAPIEGESAPAEAPPALPETFTVGVTDLSFNPINGIFNRMLKLPNGNFVTSAYWKQQSEVSDDKKYYWK